jgi:hypothetical protein
LVFLIGAMPLHGDGCAANNLGRRYLEAQTLAPPYLAPCMKHPELRQALYLGSQFSFPPRLRQVAFHPAQKSALLSEKAGVARVVTAATVRAANVLRTMHILSLVTRGFEPMIDSLKIDDDKVSTAKLRAFSSTLPASASPLAN